MQTLDQIPAEKLAELVIRSVYEGSEAGPGGTKVIPDSVQNLQRGTPPGGWTCTAVIDSPDGQDTLLVTWSPTDGYSDVVQGAGVEAKDDAADTYTPPKGAQGNAQQVLDWREEHGDEVKGMTAVGWTRARQLASGKPISLDTVKRMAQFNRHRKNSAVAPEHKDTPWKDAGRVAWLGWGGDTGIDWAMGISKRSDAAPYAKGDPVAWTWGEGTAKGTVAQVFPSRVQRTIEGATITRNGTPDNPALLIEQENGAKALKLASEVRRDEADTLPKPQPL
jgi:hypothetical protein